jgi:thymidylate synthase (FAD)
LPVDVLATIPSEQLNYVFLHELVHFKRKDILINLLMSLILIFHWFNPIWYASYKMREDQEAYDKLVDILVDKHTEKLVNDGYEIKKASKAAEKMAIEDARYVFPNACETKIVFTMNARSLINFFNHRCCNRAQWEIHQMADEMLSLVRKAAPSIFRNAGPSCICSSCPEGAMSCGKITEIREKYKKI